MLQAVAVTVAICGLMSMVFAQELYDAPVFNFEFYVNTNPDLYPGGISTLAQAEQHWIEYGISEGRQACGSFHSLQYLIRYPNLAAQFGTNYSAAIEHYLTIGLAEGLIGVVDGGSYGRWTAYNATEGLYLSASDRTAGAIDSVVWNFVEFINQWDHGRELQMAVTNGSGECYNPTEAGRLDDNTGTGTTSVLLNIDVTPGCLTTAVNPAFWLADGEKENNPSSACTVGIDRTNVSMYTMTKTVTLGAFGFPRAIFYNGSVYQPEFNSFVQTEGPTAYMPAAFNEFYSINITTGSLTYIPHPSSSSGSTQDPLIFATADNSTAMGIFTTNTIQYYGWFDFTFIAPATDATTKWTIVNWDFNVTAGSTLNFPTYIVVGTLEQVASDLPALHAVVTKAKHSTA